MQYTSCEHVRMGAAVASAQILKLTTEIGRYEMLAPYVDRDVTWQVCQHCLETMQADQVRGHSVGTSS